MPTFENTKQVDEPNNPGIRSRQRKGNPLNYHLKFRNIKPATKAATKRLMSNWSTSNPTGREAKMRTWLTEVSSIYGIQEPTLIVGDRYANYGYYRPATNTINMPYASIVTLLHEFRHALQAFGQGRPGDVEDDARGWSLSLYYSVAPRTFRALGRRGDIFFVAV